MFVVALFEIPRTWKKRRCPSTEDWIKKMWHIYRMKHYSVEEEWNLKFAEKWMKLEATLLNEITQSQKEEHGMYSLIYRF